MKPIQTILILLISLIISCEQVVEVDLPEHQPQLILSCFHDAGKFGPIDALFTASRPIQESQSIGIIKDVAVQLYESEVLLGEFSNEFSLVTYSLSSQLVQAGHTYKITAQSDGFESISATQTLPYPPTADLIEFIHQSSIQFNGKQQDIYKIEIQDEPDIDNYYEFKIYTLDTDNLPSPWRDRNLRTYNPLLGVGQKTLYLKDDTFEGEAYRIELFANTRDTTRFDIKVEVKSTTRDRYLFAKSLIAYQNTNGNPFVEPVIIHTNVENGQGLFSLENSVELKIK